jgi:hypothetical protein
MFDGNDDSGRAAEVVRELLQDTRFKFVDRSGYLRQGICPDCGKKVLYVRKSEPWRVACGRENKCGSSWTTRELLPHRYENYIKRFPPTDDNPKATADAYLREDRGFHLIRCRTWYDQEYYRLEETGESMPTVRFYIDKGRTVYWERLIGKTKADGQKANFGGQRKKNGTAPFSRAMPGPLRSRNYSLVIFAISPRAFFMPSPWSMPGKGFRITYQYDIPRQFYRSQ